MGIVQEGGCAADGNPNGRMMLLYRLHQEDGIALDGMSQGAPDRPLWLGGEMREGLMAEKM